MGSRAQPGLGHTNPTALGVEALSGWLPEEDYLPCLLILLGTLEGVPPCVSLGAGEMGKEIF